MRENIEIEEIYNDHFNVKYQATIRHDKLKKYQVINGKDSDLVKQKALAKMAQWDAQWDKELHKQKNKSNLENNIAIAGTKTQKAMQEIESLSQIISKTVRNNISWEHFYNVERYLPKPDKPFIESLPNKSNLPKSKPKPRKLRLMKKPEPPLVPAEPKRSDPQYTPQIDVLDKVFKSRCQEKEIEMENKFQLDHKNWVNKRREIEEEYRDALLLWEKDIEEYEKNYQEKLEKWQKGKKALEKKKKETLEKWKRKKEKSLEKWKQREQDYIEERNKIKTTTEKIKEEYLNGSKDTVIDHCNQVLSDSEYPDYFPQSYILDYFPSNKMIIIDYQLPSPHNIPTLKELRYIQTTNQFKEIHISQSQINNLYDSVVYQIALCTIYKLFNANHPTVIVLVVFNGFVESINPSTGKTMIACIVSLQANRNELMEINLENVEPKACFRKLKGVGSSQLYNITPIAPILNISREDKRFIPSYEVAYDLDESVNIAAMDWEDFEHLIRELFEQEFAQYGGEVKITQASRDRGVDAVAFDPDPIRGGKIVIQAKRYTNTVGVSAVRDLYGTVINEGATKGILISTADYGPDAYDFAKGKPLSLLNGGNLLHLLEKHGHKAKIDLQEAKKLITEKEKQKELIY